MIQQYSPPVAVHFIWNTADRAIVDPILDKIRESFARDIDRPFSRGLNIPLFFYSSLAHDIPPVNAPRSIGEKNVVFVFCSKHTCGYPKWATYIDNLPTSGNISYVPLAIDKLGKGHASSGTLEKLNFIRMYEFSELLMNQYLLLNMAHEIYKHGLLEIGESEYGKSYSIKLFLSHAKSGSTGKNIAIKIKNVIENTNMVTFFDSADISSGFKFNEEIEKHIDESTLVAIETDLYASRYWCQREVLYAKEKNCPVVVVDCLEKYEDRMFPATSNVPCVHINPEKDLEEADVLRVVIVAVLETLRFKHVEIALAKYMELSWIDKSAEISARPPEIHQIIELKNSGKDKICYPEPPVYAEEAEWVKSLDITAYTPLWKPEDENIFLGKKVGLSISEINTKSFSEHHIHDDQLKRLSQDFARHLLARSATIFYGGDLRKDGFTEFILDEAIALKNRMNSDDIHVHNYLAWPLYVSGIEVVEWRARFKEVMTTVECRIPCDISDSVDKEVFLTPDCIENQYIWSRCLTEMRELSINESTARVCAGGKLSGYKGKMPGVLEEIVLAIKHEKPLFLLGGFGGVVGAVCKSISTSKIDISLTYEWQKEHNEGYSDLQQFAAEKGNATDYNEVCKLLTEHDVEVLAARVGLDHNEYVRLMESPFVEECLYIIIKGLNTIS